MSALLDQKPLPVSTLSPNMPSRSTLYQFVAQTLHERILSGAIPAGGSLPSERELCLEFNVSRQTVRNALGFLSEKGLLDSRAGMGHYVRSRQNRTSRKIEGKRNTRQVGVICSPKQYLENPMQWKAFLGVKSRLSQEGYSVALSVSQKDEKAGFHPCYQHWLDDGDMDGYIGVSVSAPMQAKLFESGFPTLSMGYVWEDIGLPSIALDFRQLYSEVLRYVAGLGFQKVAATVVLPDSSFTKNVERGLAEGCLHLRWPAGSVQVRRYADTAYDLISSIRVLMRSNRRPQALILQGDDHFEEVMRFFEAEGIRVPEDLHVTAVQINDAERFRFADRVAYYDFDYLEIGRRVGQRMLDLMAGKNPKPLHQEILLGRIVDPAVVVA